MGGGVRGGARGGRGGARKEPVKSKEDLDAEMDVYMSSLIVKKLKYLKLAWPGQSPNPPPTNQPASTALMGKYG